MRFSKLKHFAVFALAAMLVVTAVPFTRVQAQQTMDNQITTEEVPPAVDNQIISVEESQTSDDVENTEQEPVITEAVIEKEERIPQFTFDENISSEDYEILKERFINELYPRANTYGLLRAATINNNVLSNDYLEFAIDPSNGRFTVGTTEGNPDLTTDNYQLLLYGHSAHVLPIQQSI